MKVKVYIIIILGDVFHLKSVLKKIKYLTKFRNYF